MKDPTTPEEIMKDLRGLAKQKIGIDFAVNDDAFANTVVLARGLLLLLDEIRKVEKQ